MDNKLKIFCAILISFFLLSNSLFSMEPKLFWWKPQDNTINFGDYLSKVVVERMTNKQLPDESATLKEKIPVLFGIGSIIHFARNNDIIWGAGFRENPLLEQRKYTALDVRAVRGPLTRDFLLQMGIACPNVYGDPAMLLPHLFPEFTRQEPTYEYIIIPNRGEMNYFMGYKNVVLPTEDWNQIVKKILRSRLVISSSLHGLIVAEAFGVPSRLLKMTWIEPILKYQDYYMSTGRPDFKYATSVQEALLMDGEESAVIDLQPLLDSFPYDYFN